MAASLTSVRNALPKGSTLDDDAFARRHRSLRLLLLAHVPALVALGLVRSEDVVPVAGEAAVVGLLAWLSGLVRHRRAAAAIIAVDVVAASAAVVHLSGGVVEARFHVLVALALVAVYQDWVPAAVATVLAVAGAIAGAALVPELAFADDATRAEPWAWTGVHVAAVLALAAVQVALWRAADDEHRKAARLAGELVRAQSQIEARESVSELFVNLARRNQALLDRQIDLIVGMEERETEPEQLAQLFQLDHLATRIRRNAESLLVLSGEEPPRRWGRPVPLTDVVRAAVAEVEDYRRVDVAVDESRAIAGRAVADLAHLLAELVENGLQFSPPESRVRVASVVRPDRTCVVTVEDRGIGLTDIDRSSANDLLARPPEVDLRLSKRLGFHVVSRLAARYGVKVRLDTTPGGGTTAIVGVPEELLAPVDAPVPVAPPTASRPVRPAPAPPTVAGRALTPPTAPRARPAPATRQPAAVPAAAPSVPPPGPPAPRPVPAPAPAPEPAAERPVVPAASAASAGSAAADAVAGRIVAPSATGPGANGTGSLPRRVPQASLSPQLRAMVQHPPARPGTPPPGAPVAAERRSPDEVRSMLSRFQAGQARGRQDAGAAGGARQNDHEDR